MSVNTDFKNEPIFKYFENICKIPHGSGNEKALADYVEGFARERGLYSYRDSFDNILIRRPASDGYENRPAVLLQGHLDMVCEKLPELEFDFTKDAIETVERDGCIYANGTTLGADDGAAVAVMLAILDDKEYKAPLIECLFTTGEETALIGATNFDYSKIIARRMINIDTEREGEAVAGSSGGVRCKIERDIETSAPEDGVKTMKITIGGLKGGHSGTDIALGRISACVLMSRLLRLFGDRITLAKINGGNMDNAIARDCTAEIVCTDTDQIKDTARDFETTIKAKLNPDDSAFFITVEEIDDGERVMTREMSDSVISLANELQHGVYAMSRDMEGLVESSANFASFKERDGKLVLTMSFRSSVASTLASMKETIGEKAGRYGFEVIFEGEYPGWQYSPDSPMIQIFKDSYKRLSGREGSVVAIHAGLECGLIKSNIPDMDIISVGPTIEDAHTPNEHMDIGSFMRVYELVKVMINE